VGEKRQGSRHQREMSHPDDDGGAGAMRFARVAGSTPRCIVAGLLLAAVSTATNAVSADELVMARPGRLPIVLTAPHGGRSAVDGVHGRTRGKRDMDARTFEFTEALAGRLRVILGAEPYVVAARFHRQYIDANRREEEALEEAAARPTYRAYHARIRDYVTEVRRKFPGGALLLDIHGQATDPDTVHRGTQNGATVADMMRRHGADALIGQKSVLGILRAKGHTVFPPNTPPGKPREDRRYNGGFTVQTYGSNNGDGIDAIQLELGAGLRRTPRFVDDLAEAIAVYCRTYLAPCE
jgi:N-formylglutamate amidohydrolase